MSNEMNPWLAQMYNTAGVSEETTKVAHADLFCKLAADNNIDLSQLSQEEVGNLYLNTFPEEAMKLAQEEEEKKKEEEEEEEEEEKESAAYAYHQQQLGWQEKMAEADIMGRTMAHAMVHELGLIKEAEGSGASRPSTAEFEGAQKAKAQAHAKRVQEAAYEGPAAAGSGASRGKQMSTREAKMFAGKEKARRFLGTRKGKALAIGAGVLAAGGAGAAAYKGLKGKKKAASAAAAFEELSANHAVKVAAAGGYDEDEAFERVKSVFTLGLEETEKVAYVQDTDDAIHVRGLEYLEAAGYPVNWDEVFG